MARDRIRCTAFITSACCARNAFPKSVVYRTSAANRLSTSGKTTSAATLGSQFCCRAASISCEPCRLLFACSHCHASTTSTGYVEAASTWPSSESGYKAMGATRVSSCCGLIIGPGAGAGPCAGGGCISGCIGGCCATSIVPASSNTPTRPSAWRTTNPTLMFVILHPHLACDSPLILTYSVATALSQASHCYSHAADQMLND